MLPTQSVHCASASSCIPHTHFLIPPSNLFPSFHFHCQWPKPSCSFHQPIAHLLHRAWLPKGSPNHPLMRMKNHANQSIPPIPMLFLSLYRHIHIIAFSLSTIHRTHPIIFTFMPHELHHHSHINTHAYPFLLSTPFSLSTPHIPHAYPFLTPLLPLIPRFLSP